MYYRLSVGMRLGLGLSAFVRVADFGGRSTRTEVWCFFAVLLLFNVAAMALGAVSGLGMDFLYRPSASVPNAITWLALEHLPLLPVFALTARRLHDIGIPGWPGPINAAVALVLGGWQALSFRTQGVEPPSTAWEVLRVVTILLFYAGLFWTPKRGPNRYGADPRGIEAA